MKKGKTNFFRKPQEIRIRKVPPRNIFGNRKLREEDYIRIFQPPRVRKRKSPNL